MLNELSDSYVASKRNDTTCENCHQSTKKNQKGELLWQQIKI